MLGETADCRAKKGKQASGAESAQNEDTQSTSPTSPSRICLFLTLAQVPSLSALRHLPSHTNSSTSHCSHVPGTWVRALSHCCTPSTKGWKSGEWSRWWVGLDYSWQRQAGWMTVGKRSLRGQYLPSLKQGSPPWWGRFPSTPRMCWAVGQEGLLFSGEWQVELQAPSLAALLTTTKGQPSFQTPRCEDRSPLFSLSAL